MNDVIGTEQHNLQRGRVMQSVTTIKIYFKQYNYVAGVGEKGSHELKILPNLSLSKVNIIDS